MVVEKDWRCGHVVPVRGALEVARDLHYEPVWWEDVRTSALLPDGRGGGGPQAW